MNKITKLGKQSKTIDVKDWTWNGESRTISGYGAIFNNKDKSDDVLLPGCFAKSINDRGPESQANDKIILLWQHDTKQPLGRITKLYEDAKGLYFEAVIDEFELGDRAIKQLESGTLNQFSIGYSYVWEACKWDDVADAFMVGEVKLYEISIVSFGCNPETEYLGLKSEDRQKHIDALNDQMKEFKKGMPLDKQMVFDEIIAKTASLSANVPDEHPHVEKKADEPTNIFAKLKI